MGFVSFSKVAQAANHYVRQGATGSANGNDWTNAYTALPSTLVRGDTYYVADGTYAGRTFNTGASGSTLITVKKAIESDHGVDTGWVATYGDGQAVFGALSFASPYWLIEGVTGGGPGMWTSGFGFKISYSGADPLLDIETGSADFVTLRHIELQGTRNSSGGGWIAQDAVAVRDASNFTLSYFYTHAIGRCPFFLVPAPDSLIEYGYIADFVSTSAAHSEVMSTQGWSTGNMTFRYNVVTHIEGTGGIMWDNAGNHNSEARIYGNVFYRASGDNTWTEANGVLGGWTGGNGEDFYNMKVYNNSFINVNQATFSEFPIRYGNNVASNNLWYNSESPTFGRFATHNYNHFINSGGTHSEANGTSATSGDPFVDYANLNFALKMATVAGQTLGSPYTMDALNNIRSTDGTWDRGAYEYTSGGGGDTESPVLPANFNLAATSPSQSSISVSWTASTDNIGVTGYLVERCQGSGCSNFAHVGTPTASPFVDSGLTANTFYNYHVRATDAAGNLSGWSNVVGATTQAPDTTPPTAPSNLQASVVSSSNINLTWTASTDNVAVTNYKVERCTGTSCTNFVQIGTPTTNSYSDTGLSPTTLYRYRVRATDAAGNNSGYSNIAEGTTPVAPPTPTFVAEYETAWNSTTSPKTTSNFSVQTGDILVAYAVNESSGSTIATPPTGTLSGTWTLRQTVSASNFTYLRLWTLAVASNQSNVNVTFTNAGGNWGADVLHFRNASSVGVTAQGMGATGNPTLTLNGVSENSSIVMVNGDWTAKTGSRTYTTTQAGTFTETSAYADGSTYGVEAGYYANAGTSGNKTIGLTAPTGMTWALAAVEIKGNPSTGSVACNTVTTTNFSDAGYSAYGAPFDVFTSNTPLLNATCTSADTHTINLTTGVTGDTTRIVYTKGYWYDAIGAAWRQYSGTCTGALNGDWCQGSVSATITDANVSTASSSNPTYLVGMTCSVQGGSWKCGCRDTSCTNFSWQIQGAGM